MSKLSALVNKVTSSRTALKYDGCLECIVCESLICFKYIFKYISFDQKKKHKFEVYLINFTNILHLPLHRKKANLRRNVRAAKKFTAKSPCEEKSLHRKVFEKKFHYIKMSHGEISYGKMSYGEKCSNRIRL